MALPKTKARFVNPDTVRRRLLNLTPEQSAKALIDFGFIGCLEGLKPVEKQKMADYCCVLAEEGLAQLKHSNQYEKEYFMVFPMTRRILDILTPDNYGDIINEFVGYMDFQVPFMQKQYDPYPSIDWEAECLANFTDLQKKIFPV